MFQDHAVTSEVSLQDLVGNYLDPPGTPKNKITGKFNKGEAVFSDGSKLEFPPEVVFEPDNHFDESGVLQQMRLRVIPPTGPAFFIPQYCSKKYVLSALDRLKKGV